MGRWVVLGGPKLMVKFINFRQIHGKSPKSLKLRGLRVPNLKGWVAPQVFSHMKLIVELKNLDVKVSKSLQKSAGADFEQVWIFAPL